MDIVYFGFYNRLNLTQPSSTFHETDRLGDESMQKITI